MDNFNLKKFLIENKITRNSRLLAENQVSAEDYALRVLRNFKRVRPFDTPTILRKVGALKDNIERQYDTQEIGAETVYLELEDLEDALNNGESLDTALDNAISNLEGTENNGEESITNLLNQPNKKALGIFYRRTTPQDDYSTDYIWIEENMERILTSFYEYLGSNDRNGIQGQIRYYIYDTAPSDWGDPDTMTVGEFLQTAKNDYDEYGFVD